MSTLGTVEDECRRAVILGAFIKAWGLPESRTEVRGPLEAPTGVYAFPAGEDRVARLATCGLSSQPRCADAGYGWELLLVLPPDWGGHGLARASAYLANLAVWSARPDVAVRKGATTSGSPYAPEGWPAAVLLDEPLGEPEELAVLHVGSQHVEVLWVVPIYPGEADRVLLEGPEWLHRTDGPEGLSLVDVRRRPRT